MPYNSYINTSGEKSQITETMLENDPSFAKVRKQIKKQMIFTFTGKTPPYQYKFIGHPFQDSISLRRLGGRGAERVYQKGVNNTDIKTADYVPNLVTNNFFNSLDLENENFVFFINAFFPFDEVYSKKMNSKLSGLNKSLADLGIGSFVSEGIHGDFDDENTVLLDSNYDTAQTFKIDKNSLMVELANDDQIQLLTQNYLKIRQQFLN